MKIRVDFQGASGNWFQGEIVGYTTIGDYVYAVILADYLRKGKDTHTYEECKPFLGQAYICDCDVITAD